MTCKMAAMAHESSEKVTEGGFVPTPPVGEDTVTLGKNHKFWFTLIIFFNYREMLRIKHDT